MMNSIYSEKFICNNLIIALILLQITITPLKAQPSGDPHGPIAQKYEIPEVKGAVYYVSPNGSEKQSGGKINKPTTLECAVKKAMSGDVIVLRGGTYRTGDLVFNQGIIFQAYGDEHPVLKGTYIAKEWKNAGNGLWVTSWSRLFPCGPESWWNREKEEAYTPLYRFNDDMVFIDGEFLQSAGSVEQVNTNTFYIDYIKGLVYIGIDPKERFIEITAFNVALHRVTGDVNGKTSDHKGPVIRGIEFTQYADTAIRVEGFYPQGLSDESKHGKEVRGTLLENCSISFCSRIGAYLIGDSLIMRHCKISNTSTEGLYIVASSDVLIEKNIFTKNNIENITGFYPAAVKIFNQCYRVTCKDNLIIDLPNSQGVWYDVGNVNGVFINNRVENVGDLNDGSNNNSDFWGQWYGFFFEISKGAVCAGNLFINCDGGIFVLNSSDVEIYQNTLINSVLLVKRDERSAVSDHFGWHPVTGPDVDERDGHICINNLLVADSGINYKIFMVQQPVALCQKLNKPQFTKLDHNVFVRKDKYNPNPLISWSPVQNDTCAAFLFSTEEIHKICPEFSANDRYFNKYDGPIFKNTERYDFQLLKSFPGYNLGDELSEKISNLLGIPSGTGKYVGAFPVKKD